MDEVRTGYKIAMSIAVMCFIIGIGMTILMIARNFWNHTESAVERPLNAVSDATAWQLASSNTPVPVASIWKVLNDIDPLGDVTTTLCTDFTIGSKKTPSHIYSTDRKDVKNYLGYKAYFTYEWLPGDNLRVLITLDDM